MKKPAGFAVQTVYAPEPDLPQLEVLQQAPVSDFELRLQTTPPGAGEARIPSQGAFKVIVEPGPDYALLDNDATDADQSLRVQVPAQAFDLAIQAESPAGASPLCQPSAPAPDTPHAQIEQRVQAKIAQLNAAGQGHCTVPAPVTGPQKTQCNTTAKGIQCRGAVKKTLSADRCPEMAVHAEGFQLNHALDNVRLFVSAQKNLVLNRPAAGIFSVREQFNANINQGTLTGIVVGGQRHNQLNFNHSQSHFKGLFALANAASVGFNLNNGGTFEGLLCSAGQVRLNNNRNSPVHYHPEILRPWATELPELASMICPPRQHFYNQTTPLSCNDTAPSALQLNDPLYGLSQSLDAETWYRLPQRPSQVPADWASPDGQQYVLHFDNQGTQNLNLRWLSQNTPPQVPAAVKVIPAVDCVQPNPSGGYTAFLSYTNLMTGPVSLSGAANQISPQPTQGSVPELFEAGQSPVYPNSPGQVDFLGPRLHWQVGARQVSVQAEDPALRCPNLTQQPELLITDVVLNETGLSILGQAAPGSLQPDYAGQAIALTLTGTFRDAQQAALALPDFLFTLAPPLIQQTFTGTEPQARVLLDDSILLEVTAVTATEIQAVLQTKKLPDLYLKGLHKLSVEQGDWYTDALIQVGDPVAPADSLRPVISSVDVLRDTQNLPVHLRLTGQNFMVFPKFSYTTVDGVFGFGYQTEVTADGQFETLVHIPSPETFDQLSEHTVIMATPFGVAFKVF